MKRYWLRLFPEQPLHLDDDHLIPAAAVLGAIAAVALSTCVDGHEHDTGPCGADCRYWTLFGEYDDLRVSTAYAGTGDETEPFLATARTCSASPGFKVAGGHGVFDIAVRQSVFEETSGKPGRLLVPFSLRCPTCGATLMACDGTYTRQSEREFVTVGEVAAPVTTHHAALGRPRKQIIERFQAAGSLINRGVYYAAKVDIPERLDGLLHDLVAGGLWIGGRRSRGMGAVRAELAPRPPDSLSLTERIARFNRAIRADRRFYTALDAANAPGDEGVLYFTLDMADPVLPAVEAAPSIRPLLPTLSNIVPVRQWLSTRSVGGWHAAAALPRRTQIGTTGVVLYRVPPEISRAAVEELLAFAESDGLGVGRQRGYGAISICDPFHLVIDPV